jgi:UDP-N-acetylglucosamine acyltransferase
VRAVQQPKRDIQRREPAPTHRLNIHPTAIVHPSAQLGRDVEVGPFCLVGEHVRIGDGTILLAHVIANGWTEIGSECEVHPFSVIGGASQDKKFRGERSFVRIGSRNVIREYVTINRGTGEDSETVVGDDNLLLAYVHIAHNCRIGNRVVMSNNAQLAGHVIVGDGANIGGMVGVHQFVRIGQMVMIAGMARVVKDVMPFMMVEGHPSSVRGLNKVGMKRRGVSAEAVAELEEAYHLLFRSSVNLAVAVSSLREKLKTPEGKELVAFLEANSERGVLKR